MEDRSSTWRKGRVSTSRLHWTRSLWKTSSREMNYLTRPIVDRWVIFSGVIIMLRGTVSSKRSTGRKMLQKISTITPVTENIMTY